MTCQVSWPLVNWTGEQFLKVFSIYLYTGVVVILLLLHVPGQFEHIFVSTTPGGSI